MWMGLSGRTSLGRADWPAESEEQTDIGQRKRWNRVPAGELSDGEKRWTAASERA